MISLRRLPLLVFHVLFLALPLLFTVSTDELFEFPKMLLVYCGAILMVFYWAYNSIQERKWIFARTPLDIPILGFVLSQMLSTVFSINLHTSLLGYYSRFNGGLFSTLGYVILFYGFVWFVKKSDVGALVRTLFAGGIVTALYAFPEHFGHSPSCLLITSEFSVDCWVQDVKTRVFGTLGQPNWLAAYMVVMLPLVVAKAQSLFSFSALKKEGFKNSHFAEASRDRQELSIKNNSTIHFILYTLYFILFSSVLLFTQSRSGIAGAFLALGLFCAFSWFTQWKEKKQVVFSLLAIRYAVFVSVVFLLLTLWIANPVGTKLLSFLPSKPSVSNTVSTTPAPAGTQLENGGSESGDIRKVVWSGAINVWKRYPLFGSGVETFGYSYFKDRPEEHNLLSEWDFLYNKAHNEFLNYLATTGIVGLIAYVVMYGSFVLFPLLWAFQYKGQREKVKGLDVTNDKFSEPHGPSADGPIPFLLATSSGLLGLAVSNFLGFSTVVVSFLTFLLPAFAVKLHSKQDLVLLGNIKKRSKLQLILMGLSIFVVLWLLLSVLIMYRSDTHHSRAKTFSQQSDAESSFYESKLAVELSPNEPVFRDDLAYTAARIAYALGTSGNATDSAVMAQFAIENSDETIRQNPVHINFYKTRVRIFLLLSQLNPAFYAEARNALEAAIALSPTDSRLVYNLAIVAQAEGNVEEFERLLLEAVKLRPIDEQAHLALAEFYEEKRDYAKAKEHYDLMLKFNPGNEAVKERLASMSGKLK